MAAFSLANVLIAVLLAGAVTLVLGAARARPLSWRRDRESRELPHSAPRAR
jgi:hypothetical protein